MAAFSGLFGAGSTVDRTVRSNPPAMPLTRATVDRTSVTASRAVSSTDDGRRTYSSRASTRSCLPEGTRRGCHSTGSGAGASGDTSSSTWPMSIALSPSTSAGWVFVTTATRLPVSPSIR
jgi:hypothetical protein